MYQNSLLISMLAASVAECNSGQAFGEHVMRRLSTIAFVGMLALTMDGCGLGEESSAPTPSPPQVVNAQPAAKPFDKPPMVSQNPEKSTISLAPPTLIQPTNANQRAKQVQKGRQDPFAGLFVQAGTGVSTSSARPQTIVPQLPTLPGIGVPQPVAVGTPRRPSSSETSDNGNPGSQPTPLPSVVPDSSAANSSPPVVPSSIETNPLPPVAPSSTTEAALPPPPQAPDLARGVAVTGVLQVGSEPHAIVKVPNEATSRYVRVGQRLSNGQVLVKRIEVNEGSEPVVILEQYGVEVAKEVGENPANQGETDTPAGASPDEPTPENAPSPADASPDEPTPENAPSPADASPDEPTLENAPSSAE